MPIMNRIERSRQARQRAESMHAMYSSGVPVRAIAEANKVTRQWVYLSLSRHGFKPHLIAGVKPSTFSRAMGLYFEIEKHFALGGSALSLREVRQMLELNSASGALRYLSILCRWKLVAYQPFKSRTIHLVDKPNYPPVEYRESNHAHE